MRALITGIGGQDGSYLAEQLLADGHEVVGTVLGSSNDYPLLEGFRDRIRFVDLDLHDPAEVLSELAPDELYHLAAVSFVPAWWEDPVGLTGRTSARSLRCSRRCMASPRTRAFFASSAEIFAGSRRAAPE